MFDILLTLQCGGNCLMRLEIDQRLNAVPLGEAIRQALPMLVNAPHKIVGHTDIQCSSGLAREDVYPIGHLVGWIAGSSPAMTDITPASASARRARPWNPCPAPAWASRGRPASGSRPRPRSGRRCPAGNAS